jgi:hypothetical protein
MRGDPRGPEPIRQVRALSKQRAPFPAIDWLPIRGGFFASGAACLVANPLKVTSNGKLWEQAAAYLLMVHGRAAMGTLMLRGARFPLHIGRAWSCIFMDCKKQNLDTDAAMRCKPKSDIEAV